MEQMYKGIPFSPTATLTANIGAADTIIPVSDVDAFPDAPNIATIGSIAGPNETIIYTGKTTTSLTGCTRGVEGTASDWAVDELIGRNFTAKDHTDMVKNIEELENSKLDATYKVDVVNTADVSVPGKALDARQNNPNITGTLAQKVDSNTRQINVLSSKFNVNKIYTSFTQINGSGAVTTPIAILFDWMEDNSIAMLEISAPNTNVYPAQFGQCIIYKSNGNRDSIEFIDTTGRRYTGTCHSSFSNVFSGFEQLVTKAILNNALAINNLTQV